MKLSLPTYYSDPAVKHGYMRGAETVDYVARIRARWDKYRRVAGAGAQMRMSGDNPGVSAPSIGDYEPQKARRKNKYKI